MIKHVLHMYAARSTFVGIVVSGREEPASYLAIL